MTNEEAIKIIDKGLDIGNQMPFLTVDQMNEAKQKAIKALSAKPCEDAISRTEFIVALVDSGIDHLKADNLIEIGQIVFGLPSVIPSRPTGHWIKARPTQTRGAKFICSSCRESCVCLCYDTTKSINRCDYKYCPNCGAVMMESEVGQ